MKTVKPAAEPRLPVKPLKPSFVQKNAKLKKMLQDTPVGGDFRPYEVFIMHPIPAVIDMCDWPTPNAKRIYGRMCRYQGEKGEAFPLQGTVGKELSISRHGVIDALANLEEHGWIRSIPTGGAKFYRFLKNDVIALAEKIQSGERFEPCCWAKPDCYVHDIYNQRRVEWAEEDAKKNVKDEKKDASNIIARIVEDAKIAEVAENVGENEKVGVQKLNNGCSETEQLMFSICTTDVQKLHNGCSETEHIRESSEEGHKKELEKRINEKNHIAPAEAGEGVGVSGGSLSDGQVTPEDFSTGKKGSGDRKPFVARNPKPVSLDLINQGVAEIVELYMEAYEERVGVPMVSDKERGVLRSLVKQILVSGSDLSTLKDIILHDVADNSKANRTMGAIANLPRYQTWTATIAPGSCISDIPFDAIIDYLNTVTGSQWDSTDPAVRECILERWVEKHGLEDFKKVVDNMAVKWGKDVEKREWLRPDTLFGKKFGVYLRMQLTLVDKGVISRGGANAAIGLQKWLKGRERADAGGSRKCPHNRGAKDESEDGDI